MIPIVQIPINSASSFGFTALRSIIKDGKLSVVTAIIKDKIVPSCAPFIEQGFCHRDCTKNIRIHGDTHPAWQEQHQRDCYA